MNADDARSFLRDHHRAVMSTVRRDGLPQLSPVVVALDADGYATISSRETAVKVRNLRRDPRAALCVFSDQFFGNWIQIEGDAHLLSLPDAMEALIAYYRTIGGEHPNWDEYREAMRQEQRCLIRVPITRAGPSISG